MEAGGKVTLMSSSWITRLRAKWQYKISQKLPNNLGSVSLFVALSCVFIGLIVGVFLGFAHRAYTYRHSTDTEGSFIDGLIANGLSVIVSTLFIVPLTTTLSDIIRERRIAPVRRSFVNSIGTEIDRLAHFYLVHFSTFAMGLRLLGMAIETEALSTGMKNLTDSLSNRFEVLKHEISSESAKARPDAPILRKAIETSKLLSTAVKSMYDVLYRESALLENTLTFAMPLFSGKKRPSTPRTSRATHQFTVQLAGYDRLSVGR
jgi:hypothetical protein